MKMTKNVIIFYLIDNNKHIIHHAIVSITHVYMYVFIIINIFYDVHVEIS